MKLQLAATRGHDIGGIPASALGSTEIPRDRSISCSAASIIGKNAEK
jgi:hypothetical protein